MNGKWLKIALIVFAAATACAGLAACAPQEEAPYDFVVTFDYNEPDVAEGQARKTPALYGLSAADPHLSFYPGKVYVDYKFPIESFEQRLVKDGEWYLPAEIDEEGNPVREEEHGTVVLGEKWDFDDPEKNIVTESFTLYAKLDYKPRIFLMDGDNVAMTYYGDAGTQIAEPTAGTTAYPTVAGKTYYNCYTDPEMEEEFHWDYLFSAEEDLTVYGKFVEGSERWSFVSTAEEYNAAISADKDIWLENDITFTADAPYAGNGIFNRMLNGNHHALKGITVSISGRTEDKYGVLFYALQPLAHIYDVTFENVQATISFDAAMSNALSPFIGFFAYQTFASTQLENVTVTGELTLGALGVVVRDNITLSESVINDQRTQKEGLTATVTLPS